jgi:hypothetical protein
MMLIFTVSLSYGNVELIWLIDVIYFPKLLREFDMPRNSTDFFMHEQNIAEKHVRAKKNLACHRSSIIATRVTS